ncbi:Exostosin family protein [Melia azedarach]|uniref:Exostosin family protein n=1 Tax=Melia azedarach TaxID=155640 RepID=A0ACC1XZ27_MELAZ|nr:Exostosin family protein [Melia azedarach]
MVLLSASGCLSVFLPETDFFSSCTPTVRREKAAAQKRRKKEKKRRNKKKKELCGGEEIRENRSRHEHKKIRKCWDTTDCQMSRENENQLLDRSSLTEDLEQAISDSLYDSSGNTANIKGKEHRWSINGCRKHGSIIQVDLLHKGIRIHKFYLAYQIGIHLCKELR